MPRFEYVIFVYCVTEDEVSFTLNLYSDGYSIGKPSEVGFVVFLFLNFLMQIILRNNMIFLNVWRE